jgi:hypothetical protein
MNIADPIQQSTLSLINDLNVQADIETGFTQANRGLPF